MAFSDPDQPRIQALPLLSLCTMRDLPVASALRLRPSKTTAHPVSSTAAPPLTLWCQWCQWCAPSKRNQSETHDRSCPCPAPYSIRREKLSGGNQGARRPGSLDLGGAVAAIQPLRRLSRFNGARGWPWGCAVLGNQPYSMLHKVAISDAAGPWAVVPPSSQRGIEPDFDCRALPRVVWPLSASLNVFAGP